MHSPESHDHPDQEVVEKEIESLGAGTARAEDLLEKILDATPEVTELVEQYMKRINDDPLWAVPLAKQMALRAEVKLLLENISKIREGKGTRSIDTFDALLMLPRVDQLGNLRSYSTTGETEKLLNDLEGVVNATQKLIEQKRSVVE